MLHAFTFGAKIAKALKDSAGKDEVRPVLCNTFYLDRSEQIEGDERTKIYLVATDTHRMLIVPLSPDKVEGQDVAPEGIWRIESFTKTGCIARQVEGSYPNWRCVVSIDSSNSVGSYDNITNPKRGHLRLRDCYLDVNYLPTLADRWKISQQGEGKPYLFLGSDGVKYILMPITKYI